MADLWLLLWLVGRQSSRSREELGGNIRKSKIPIFFSTGPVLFGSVDPPC